MSAASRIRDASGAFDKATLCVAFHGCSPSALAPFGRFASGARALRLAAALRIHHGDFKQCALRYRLRVLTGEAGKTGRCLGCGGGKPVAADHMVNLLIL